MASACDYLNGYMQNALDYGMASYAFYYLIYLHVKYTLECSL